nr:putative reverse transcriptase domain-containing protein [Tanacetum cinerariifolium]
MIHGRMRASKPKTTQDAIKIATKLRSKKISTLVECQTGTRRGKANVVADTLSRKEREPPLRVRALVMTISLDLPRQISNAQTEARKPKNIKKEDVGDCDHARVP